MKVKPRSITAKQFEEAVGRPPENDDLERCNCVKAGTLEHMCCGWDEISDLPWFMAPATRMTDKRRDYLLEQGRNV